MTQGIADTMAGGAARAPGAPPVGAPHRADAREPGFGAVWAEGAGDVPAPPDAVAWAAPPVPPPGEHPLARTAGGSGAGAGWRVPLAVAPGGATAGPSTWPQGDAAPAPAVAPTGQGGDAARADAPADGGAAPGRANAAAPAVDDAARRLLPEPDGPPPAQARTDAGAGPDAARGAAGTGAGLAASGAVTRVVVDAIGAALPRLGAIAAQAGWALAMRQAVGSGGAGSGPPGAPDAGAPEAGGAGPGQAQPAEQGRAAAPDTAAGDPGEGEGRGDKAAAVPKPADNGTPAAPAEPTLRPAEGDAGTSPRAADPPEARRPAQAPPAAAAPDAPTVALDEGRTRIDLAPPELGRVRIDLSLEDGRLSVALLADRDGTGDLLRRHAPDLLATLRDLGFADTALSFGGNPDRRNGPPRAAPRDGSVPDPAVATVTAAPVAQTPPPRHGMIDLRL